MFNFLDADNVELASQIEPEYSAIYNTRRRELYIFFDNALDDGAKCDSVEEAQKLFDDWCEQHRNA